MKKFLATILSAVLVLSLGTGAFAATTPAQKAKLFKQYTAAMEKLETADSMVMDMNMDMTMTIDGQEMATSIVATVSEVMEDGVPTQMYMNMDIPTISGLGDMPELTTEMYYQDGWAYMETQGQKIKMEMPIDEFVSQAGVSSLQNVDFTEDMITDITYKARGYNKTYTITLSGEALQAASSEFMDQFATATVVEGMEGITYGDVTISCVLDRKNLLKTMGMVFDMTIEVEGIEVAAAYDMTMDIVQLGGVEIEFPEDLDDYVDFSAFLEEALGAMGTYEENTVEAVEGEDAAVEEEAVEGEDAAVEEEAVEGEDAAAEEEAVEGEDAAAEEEVTDEDVAPEDAAAEEEVQAQMESADDAQPENEDVQA